jgi:hypothetical protein
LLRGATLLLLLLLGSSSWPTSREQRHRTCLHVV